MRFIVFLLSIYSFNLFACADITGKYKCVADTSEIDPYEIEYKVSEKNGVHHVQVIDDLSDITFIADGKTHKLGVEEDGMYFEVNYTLNCKAQKYILNASFNFETETYKVAQVMQKTTTGMTTKVTEQLFGEEISYTETCTKY
jgi:hypothetical protein